MKRDRAYWKFEARNPVHHDAFGISAASDPAGVFILTVVGEDRDLVAELLQVCLAVLAYPARIDHATDRGQVAFLELLHVASHFHHAPDDFMTRHAGVSSCAAPFVASDMNVRVTNSAEKDLDLDIIRCRIPTLERERLQWLLRGVRRITFSRKHDSSPSDPPHRKSTRPVALVNSQWSLVTSAATKCVGHHDVK